MAAQGGWKQLCRTVGVPDHLVAAVAERAEAKLAAEPIEDLRLDFEDGYGAAADDVEDADAVAVADRLADARGRRAGPGLRGSALQVLRGADPAPRAADLGPVPQLAAGALGRAAGRPGDHLPEGQHGQPGRGDGGRLRGVRDRGRAAGRKTRFEIQVETPPLILGADGTAPVAAAIHAGAGRVTSLHYGTYDYSASLQVSAEYQSMEHPVADYAKDVMQAAVAGTGVHLSDGSTNLLPVGTDEQIQAAWQLHHRLVRRSLERAIYQGWDLHPAQLPTRFIANIAFYREGFDRAAARLHAYLTKSRRHPGRAGHGPGAGAVPLPRLRLRRGHRRRADRRGRSRRRPVGAARPAEVRHRERGGRRSILITDRAAHHHRPQGSDLVSSTTPTRPSAALRGSPGRTAPRPQRLLRAARGHPPQTELLTDRAMFTEAYAVIPRGVMRDIVTSYLPFWANTRLWVIARPLSGFAETFSQYIVEVSPAAAATGPSSIRVPRACSSWSRAT